MEKGEGPGVDMRASNSVHPHWYAHATVSLHGRTRRDKASFLVSLLLRALIPS